jgi:hypothetical protein
MGVMPLMDAGGIVSLAQDIALILWISAGRIKPIRLGATHNGWETALQILFVQIVLLDVSQNVFLHLAKQIAKMSMLADLTHANG